ncbi:DUF7845 domain-containing protein [Natrarchaeobius chitinivorans]|uniref:DUF7845 domain-containing protein n=1 Tax=Natrarchaeobius chitinivorans TaxID=1679083 RepID=UPI001FB20B7C|nr:hypothetical protein [Natrarchaeobius chitinivorans]
MASQQFLETQCHEFDAYLNFDEYGLKPYYGLTTFRKEHDWVNNGKPSTTFEFDGREWAAVLDYDDQPILPWSDPSYTLETAYLYRVYVVCMDETYDEKSADTSQRVKGGTFTVYPRWPDMKKRDDETGEISKVNGYMDLGRPYLTVRAQASNIDFAKYVDLTAEAFAAFDVPRRYFSNPHESSTVNDTAVYVRPKRDVSGPIYAADGPIARIHQLLESDRSGYRKHVEDNRERPGDQVTTMVDSERAAKLIRGHKIGKEVKHYYMRNPDNYNPDQFGWHPKLEVSFQTSITDETIYWDREDALDIEQCRRELEEMLMNVLDWAGLDVTGGDEYHEDAYFDPERRKRRSLKLVDCPLPEIESEQENAVMRLWGDMNGSDREVTELLLTDGGEISPKDAAEKTGYSYRTIRRVVDRLEDFVRHTYGKLEVESDSLPRRCSSASYRPRSSSDGRSERRPCRSPKTRLDSRAGRSIGSSGRMRSAFARQTAEAESSSRSGTHQPTEMRPSRSPARRSPVTSNSTMMNSVSAVSGSNSSMPTDRPNGSISRTSSNCRRLA